MTVKSNLKHMIYKSKKYVLTEYLIETKNIYFILSHYIIYQEVFLSMVL